jgi:hypothetical protein
MYPIFSVFQPMKTGHTITKKSSSNTATKSKTYQVDFAIIIIIISLLLQNGFSEIITIVKWRLNTYLHEIVIEDLYI